jgi:hypothetical protein
LTKTLQRATTSTWVGLSTAIICMAALTTSCSKDAAPAVQAPQSSSAAAAATTTSALPPPPPPPAPLSDEDQVRQAVRAFQDASNTQNWDAYRDAMCPAMRAQFTGPIMDSVKKNRANVGITTANVLSVTFDGDKAKAILDATNELAGNMKIPLTLARGDDGWAVCVVA